MSKPIRVLLVEDDPQWQSAIQLLLASDSRLMLAATADCYKDALTAFVRTHPDIVLLDWKIRGEQDGLAVGQALLALGVPPERMILISGSSPSTIPAHPFLYAPKSRLAHELLPLILSVTIN